MDRRPEWIINGREGEKIGGGYFVFRRGKTTNRISIKSRLPFEHPNEASALKEANRLMEQFPGEKFVVACIL